MARRDLAEKPPSVSVVMAVCDGEAFLREALESILGQSFGDFEVVVVDDGSTDGTAGILAEYALRDGRLKVRSQPNRGLVAALNAGCAAARGALIARMDADDVAMADRLERQVAYLAEHPEVVLLGGGVVRIDARGRVVDVVRSQLRGRELRAAMEEGNRLIHPTVMFRRAAFDSAGGYRAAFRHCEDYDLFLRLMDRGEIAQLSDAVLCYRLHPGQVSVAHVDQQCVSLVAAQVSATGRRETGSDPFEGVGLVTEAELSRIGVAPGRISALKRRGRIDWAVLLVLAGKVDDAMRLFREASAAERWDGPLAADEAARFWWACVKAQARRGKLVATAGALLRVLSLRPSLLGRGLRNGLATWWAARKGGRWAAMRPR